MAVTHSAFGGSHADEALQFFGKVTDPKPGVYGSRFPAPPNGSTFHEINGSNIDWMYDAEDRTWLRQGRASPDPDYIFPFTGMKRHEPYFYEVWYEQIDYDKAYTYYLEQGEAEASGCSGVRKGRYFGRKLDWLYNHNAEFVIHTPRIDGHNASVGIAGGFSELTDEIVHAGKSNSLYDILPFQLYDGMNEHGLTVSVNVVPTDHGENRSIPLLESEVTICSRMVIRYLLDHFHSAAEAAEFMRDRMTIYFPTALHEQHYETHWLIADRSSSYIVEIIENHAVIHNVSNRAYMTNFHITGVTFDEDGTITTPETGNAEIQNGITEHGAGLERFNLIAKAYPTLETLEDMQKLMKALQYTRAYARSPDEADPKWYSEFVDGDLKLDSPLSDFQAMYALAGLAYATRSRDNPITWHSVHSVIYDLEERTMHVVPQEGENNYIFR